MSPEDRTPDSPTGGGARPADETRPRPLPESAGGTPADRRYHTGPEVAENYRYWQEHGGEWGEEYDRRRRTQVFFALQELMIAEYMEHHVPARVLEFGCGVGRHLRYLSTIAGLDVYGYDQSPTMVREMTRWATRAWMDEHVIVGAPTGRLPYADASFDIVFTAEVLIHVRPEDLGGILRELVRVSRGHLLHIEISPDYPVAAAAHHGCWKHDLVAAYAGLGLRCALLERGYRAQSPWRVLIDRAPVWTWSSTILALYRWLDHEYEYAELAALDAECARLRTQVGELQAALDRQIDVFHEHTAALSHRRWQEHERASRLASERAEFIRRAAELLGR